MTGSDGAHGAAGPGDPGHGQGPARGKIRVRVGTEADREAWDAWVAALPSADPLQAWDWGTVAATGSERPVRLVATDEAGRVRGVAQVLVRDTAAGRRVLYVPHGPAWETDAADGPAVLAALLGALRDLGRAERGIVLKFDPRATADVPAAEIRSQVLRQGARMARADLQAVTTRVIDLRPGPGQLLAGLEKDTRNLVRRSAREGVRPRVVRGADRAAYSAFADLLAATGQRAGFRVRPRAAFEAIGATFASRGDACLVLAELAGRPIAGCLALVAGRRAYYLYAASVRAPELRHAAGPYAALWACIEALAADGLESLDLWGVAEPGDPAADPAWAGFSLFKRGFGGALLRHPGTFDLVLARGWYAIRDLRERLGLRI
ncbi:MAG: lipid II:glycine glycyltransferase FemX [Candidatus Limnocylindrales bacterium]